MHDWTPSKTVIVNVDAGVSSDVNRPASQPATEKDPEQGPQPIYLSIHTTQSHFPCQVPYGFCPSNDDGSGQSFVPGSEARC